MIPRRPLHLRVAQTHCRYHIAPGRHATKSKTDRWQRLAFSFGKPLVLTRFAVGDNMVSWKTVRDTFFL